MRIFNRKSKKVDDFYLTQQPKSNVALDNKREDIIIVKLVDPSFDFNNIKLEDYDGYSSIPEPKVTHHLGLTRMFTESEKDDIWQDLQLLKISNNYTKDTQLQVYSNKAIDLGIMVTYKEI